jgi:hypothetical protein
MKGEMSGADSRRMLKYAPFSLAFIHLCASSAYNMRAPPAPPFGQYHGGPAHRAGYNCRAASLRCQPRTLMPNDLTAELVDD